MLFCDKTLRRVLIHSREQRKRNRDPRPTRTTSTQLRPVRRSCAAASMHAPICERTKRSVAAAESNFNLEHQVCYGVPSSPTAHGHWLRDVAIYPGPFHILQVVHPFAPHHVATRVANSDGGVCYQRRRRDALPTGYFFPSGPLLSPAIKIPLYHHRRGTTALFHHPPDRGRHPDSLS